MSRVKLYPNAISSGISNTSTTNVVHTGADIDELLVRPNASTREPPALTDWQQRQSHPDIARRMAGADLDSITLARVSDLGRTVELPLGDGRWNRARDHASH